MDRLAILHNAFHELILKDLFIGLMQYAKQKYCT